MKIDRKCRVRLNYSISLENGEVVDKNPDDEPLEFTTGQSEVISVLEDGIMGMGAGESGSFNTGPEDAFGARDPDAVRVVRRDDLVERGEDLEEGMVFRIKDEDDNSVIITVVSMDENEVMFDLNHPLAGAPLTFNVEILEVEPIQ